MPESLSIVIPAYNEENAIDDILRRCLAARSELIRELGLSEVEVLVVDDGSRDATRRKAEAWPEARLIGHPANRGYGAALMTGFSAARGSLLGFLDADGTCDPAAFAMLVRALRESGAGMAVGARLHEGSRMPAVRALGNRFYAALLSGLTGARVTDAASGMRVFRRELLGRLSPLPSGLHFTPAMTARAACMGVRLVEAPIPYAERTGESKLNVVADGLRFLQVILGIVFAYFPLKVFGPLSLACAAGALGWGAGAARRYLAAGAFEDWLIYRLLTVLVLGVNAVLFLAFGLLSQRASDEALGREKGALASSGLRAALAAAGAALWLAGPALNARAIVEYASTRTISQHWSWVLVGALSVLCGTALVSLSVALGCFAHLPDRGGERA